MNTDRLFACVGSLVALAATACSVIAKPPVERVGVTTVETITGAPVGAHFTLDVVGVPKGKVADLGGDDGRHLFVPLAGTTSIGLGEGDFLVVDANGTDGSASFQLPGADPRRARTATYAIWARAIGGPDRAKGTRCAPDAATGEVFCSVGQKVFVRSTDTPTFTDVAEDLLYVSADGDGDGTLERYPLFDSAVGEAFTRRDAAGRRVAELRFYEISPGPR